MRLEVRWGVLAAAALAVGTMVAAPYARLMVPYYAAVDRLLAAGRPWVITHVAVGAGRAQLSDEVQIEAWVRRRQDDPKPAARVIGRVQVGEVIETPIVFWGLLLGWPAASTRQRVGRLALGIPVFFGVEAVTTATQLIVPMTQASAMLAGDPDPVTSWDRWSRFLEAGGQFAVVCAAAMMVIALPRADGRRKNAG